MTVPVKLALVFGNISTASRNIFCVSNSVINIKIDNSFLETVEQFRYLFITVTNQNSIREEIKRKLKSGNACYHSVQKLVFEFAIQKYKD
jgi:hypothetical protein